MGIFQKLARDTAVYGLTFILARFINYFLVPFYTRVLTPGEYGTYSEIMGYIVLLQVVLILGLETGFFRYANRDDQNSSLVFSTILHFLFILSLAFFTITTFFSGSIAELMGYYKSAVIYVAAILAIDSFTSILFAKLRFERKAWKFGVFKMIKILTECGFNLLFLLFIPKYFLSHPDSLLLKFLPASPDYTYILAAIFCSCLVSLLLFVPDLFRSSFRYSGSVMKSLLIYSLPLMIAGLPGIANDSIDRLLFRFFAPENPPWAEQLGIFSANAKLAVIIVLFVQMFRYAAEPLFFSAANQPNIKKVYADILKYFAAFCMIIFVFISLYLDLFGYILGKDFRSGLAIVPALLLANVLLGINQNVSIWYKLSDKTGKAIFVTFSGLLITLVINIIFMPFYGYYAAAAAHLLSYSAMIIVSCILARKHYPIPYDWLRVGIYMISGVAMFLFSLLFSDFGAIYKYAINTVLFISYVFFILKMERINPFNIVNLFKTAK